MAHNTRPDYSKMTSKEGEILKAVGNMTNANKEDLKIMLEQQTKIMKEEQKRRDVL